MGNNYIHKEINLKTLKDNGYEVTTTGEVISHKGRKPRTLKGAIGSHGYRVVNLRLDGRSTMFCIHRLVAYSYLEIDATRPLVNHKDGDKTNNRLDNLEFVTHAENISHYYQNKC